MNHGADFDRAVVSDRYRRQQEERRKEREKRERLEKAAPLLYDACKEIRDDLEVCPPELSFGVWQRLQTAIAAAEKTD